jgi:hypothetical protein
MLGTILIVLLILMLLCALPTWPHSRNWGYFPSGGAWLDHFYSDHPGADVPALGGPNNVFHIRGICQLHFSLNRTFSRDRNRKGATARDRTRRMLIAPQLRFFAGYR